MATLNRIVRALVAVVVVAGLASTFACGGSSTGPTSNNTCQDPLANNKGGALPCTYPIVETSNVKTTNVSPSDGATLNYRTNDATVHSVYDISVADVAEMTRTADPIYLTSCLSIDGVNTIPICFSRPISGTHGEMDLNPGVNLQFNPEAVQTRYAISYLAFVHNNGQPGRTERVIKVAPAFPRLINWQ